MLIKIAGFKRDDSRFHPGNRKFIRCFLTSALRVARPKWSPGVTPSFICLLAQDKGVCGPRIVGLSFYRMVRHQVNRGIIKEKCLVSYEAEAAHKALPHTRPGTIVILIWLPITVVANYNRQKCLARVKSLQTASFLFLDWWNLSQHSFNVGPHQLAKKCFIHFWRMQVSSWAKCTSFCVTVVSFEEPFYQK